MGDETEPPYSRMAIPYLLTGSTIENGTYLRDDPDNFRDLNIELIHGRATAVDSAAKRVQLADGSSRAYDRLLLATGPRPDARG